MVNQTLDERLMGKEILVEVKLQSGGNRHNHGTSLYWGIYIGTGILFGKEVIMLKHAQHYNQAEIFFNIESGGTEEKSKIKSECCYINTDNLISVDEDAELKK